MKRFSFSLARVLDLRRLQLEVERGKLLSLQNRKVVLQGKRTELQRQVTENRDELRTYSISVRGEDLVSFTRYERATQNKIEQLTAQLAQLENELAAQRATVMEAERNLKLLEQLETKQRAEWDAECSRELEAIAADSFNAKLLAERRSNR